MIDILFHRTTKEEYSPRTLHSPILYQTVQYQRTPIDQRISPFFSELIDKHIFKLFFKVFLHFEIHKWLVCE